MCEWGMWAWAWACGGGGLLDVPNPTFPIQPPIHPNGASPTRPPTSETTCQHHLVLT